MVRFVCIISIAFFGASTLAPAQPLQPHVSAQLTDDYRIVTSNGIPDHRAGAFPNAGNPNRISAQSYSFRIPLKPVSNAQPLESGPYLFGVALNGVPFDPGTAEFWQGNPQSGWNYEALSGRINLGLDQNNAHVQPTGAYHYHGIPHGLVDLRRGGSGMVQVGYAADGYPIYAKFGYKDANDSSSGVVALAPSYALKQGLRRNGPGGPHDGTFVQDYQYVEGAGDLDASNGRYGVTPEFPEGTYYYVLTDTFPFIPRMFRGAPDASFRKGPPPTRAGARSGPPGHRPPPPGHRPPPPR